ncbi:MAG: LLM class flavin-dependent oxidoreductase [bacterium]|nr:LLM class flavin-dependent oxidoreductase [bacterium]MCP5071378.1 LLM class flavin-dependent oxidoreductase [bacterium]
MRFGMLHLYANPGDLSERQAIQEQLQLMRAAEDLDFDSIWPAEHHFSPLGYTASPAIGLAALASETQRIRLGTGVVVLPFANPIRVAEDFAFLDHLSDGRVDLGIGCGAQPPEFQHFRIDPTTAHARMEEGLEVIQQAWRNGRVDFRGEFHRFDDVPVHPTPVQTPHPPIWMAAVSGGSFERAGQLGCNLLSGTVLGLNRKVAAQRRADYLRGLRAGGHSVEERSSGCLVIVYVADTVEQARSEFSAAESWYRNTIGRFIAPESDPEDSVICGSPDFVTQRLGELQQTYGFTDLLCWTRLGVLAQPKVLRSMELMQHKVMPQLRHATPGAIPS